MFPLKDNQPTYKFPLITVLLIVANVLVFLLELSAPDLEAFIAQFALTPSFIDLSRVSTLSTFFTSQFLHAGFIHIISNMWFLKIFGNNVEEKFGSIKFLIIYLLAGLAGNLAQYLFSPTSNIPILGASGAVAGVLGAYLVFFPRHTIKTLIPFFGFLTVVNIPAQVMLFYWFLTQLLSGVGSVAIAQIGGVAFWAHVGGFATGWLIAKFGKSDASEVEKDGLLD
ncbi:rhomboid family intramembrane serine protease [Patescibacteria group bacterium]|nr:rhomboid family intramembrane serine protease [Patescibacteria group bacterium]